NQSPDVLETIQYVKTAAQDTFFGREGRAWKNSPGNRGRACGAWVKRNWLKAQYTRNGALTTGRNTCSSRPVDILGIQFVLPTSCKFCENFSVCPPTQFKATSNCGQPNTVVLISVNCPELIRSWEFLIIGSTPKSTNGASATGPAMVKRYSRFPTRLRSPPGNTICSAGTLIVYGPSRGLLGSFGTTDPSGLRSTTVEVFGRNATGDTERMTNPRRSFSQPI